MQVGSPLPTKSQPNPVFTLNHIYPSFFKEKDHHRSRSVETLDNSTMIRLDGFLFHGFPAVILKNALCSFHDNQYSAWVIHKNLTAGDNPDGNKSQRMYLWRKVGSMVCMKGIRWRYKCLWRRLDFGSHQRGMNSKFSCVWVTHRLRCESTIFCGLAHGGNSGKLNP